MSSCVNHVFSGWHRFFLKSVIMMVIDKYSVQLFVIWPGRIDKIFVNYSGVGMEVLWGKVRFWS